MRTLHVLGRLDVALDLLGMEKDALGMALVREQLPKRVRSAKSQKMQRTMPKAKVLPDEMEGF